uniref:CCHC-type domain-containing protein n=1 Tax=Micrurus carvalhoi TaxID=3147026 RepID=A0A2H6MZJ9_9SAUR
MNFGEEEVRQYLLREAPGGPDANGEPQVMYIHEPLKAFEVRAFRKEMVPFIEDPLGASEQLDLLLGPNIYTWDELNNILNVVFSQEERGLIRKAAMRVWERDYPPANPPQADYLPPEEKFPLQRPNWNNANAAHRKHMSELRTIIIKGMKEAIPRAQNMAKVGNIGQEKEEAPATFLQRIKDGLRKFAGADPDDVLNAQLVKIQFVTKAWPDISKKLQKRENWIADNIETLLKEAQKIYVNREEEVVKRNTQRSSRVMVNTVQEVLKVERGRGRGGFAPRGRGIWKGGVSQRGSQMSGGRGLGRDSQTSVTCFQCGKNGHFKRDCPELREGEQIHRLMEEEEYED